MSDPPFDLSGTFGQPSTADPLQMVAPSGAPAAPAGHDYSWLGGFLTSGAASLPGLIGIGPERLQAFGVDPEALRRWEAEHEWASFGAAALTTLIPFTAGMKLGAVALNTVPFTARLLASVAANSPRALQTARLTTPILRNMLEIAPFEVARIGVASVVGDEGSLGRVATSAGADLALAAGFGSVAGVYRSLRTNTEDEIMRGLVGPSYNGRAAPQERLAQLNEFRGANPTQDPQALTMLDNNILRLENEVRTQTPQQGERYVADLWNGTNTREVRRLFQPAGETRGGIARRTFTVGENGFESEAAWREFAGEAGLPETFLSDVQYPRAIDANNPEAATRIRDVLQRNLRTAKNGWRIEQEASTGLYVMGREVTPGRFMMLKTGNPNALLGEDLFQQVMNRVDSYTRQVENPIRRGAQEALQTSTPDSVHSMYRNSRNTFTPELMQEMENTGNLDRVLSLMGNKLGQVGKEGVEAVGRGFQWAKEYLSPANYQFTNKPIAEAVRAMVTNLYDASRAKGKVLMRGSSTLPEGQSYLGSIIRPGPAGGFEGLVRSGIEDADLGAIDSLLRKEHDLNSARRELLGMDPADGTVERVGRLLTEADRIGGIADAELRGTEGLYKRPTHEPVFGHFGLPNLWRGEFRHNIQADTGEVIGAGSGRSMAEATANARKVARQIDGVVSGDGAYRTKSFYDDEQLSRTAYGNLEKRNVGVGRNLVADKEAVFSGGDATKLTKQDLLDMVGARLQSRYERIPDLIAKNELQHDMMEVRTRYGDQVGDSLQYRLDRLAGNKGEIDRFVNQKIQKLAPFLGNNAADKLVQGWNRLESISTLFSSLAYPVMNMMAPIQQLMPRLAWLRNANAGELQSFFGFMPDIVDGRVKGFMGFLDPLLFTAKGIRSVTNPSPELRAMFARATEEGVIPAGFHQEFAGPGSHYGSGIRGAVEQGSIVKTIEQVLSWPARKVEEVTRGHAFATAYEFLKAAGVRDAQQLYYGAKQFTNKTMYQFTVADRSKIFNGPVGSAVGLFKNWSMNNMADWSTYAGAAVNKNSIAPLMWAAGGNMALAGVGGLPLVAVADRIQRMFTDKPLMQHIYQAFNEGPNGNNTADAIYFGLPALLGISLQSQLSAPMTNPARDLNFMFNFSLLDRMHKINTLAQHTYAQWESTGNPFSDPRTFHMLNYAIGPRILYKGLSEVEDGYLTSARNGRPYIGQLTGGQAVMNALGFTPTRIAQAYEASALAFDHRTEQRAMTTRLSEAFAQAVERQDQNAMTFIVQRSIAIGADVQSMVRGASARVRLAHQPILPMDFRRDPQALELFGALGIE